MSKLKDLRISRKLSLFDISCDLHISCQSLSAYEKSKNLPEMKNARKLAKYFDISIEELFNENEKENDNNENEVKEYVKI